MMKKFLLFKKMEVISNNKLENNYFRDIPCNKDILRTYWLCSNCNIINGKHLLIGALLLKWIFEKAITINKEQQEFDFNNIPAFKNEYEYVLYDILKKSSGEDKKLKINELYEWCKMNAKEISDFLDYSLKLEEEILFNNNLISYSDKTVSMYINVLNAKKKVIILGNELNNNINEIIGFKNFIKDFSLMHLREIKEVHLWEEYLVFSYLINSATVSDNQLKEFIPEYEIIEQLVDMLPLYMIPKIIKNIVVFDEK